MECGENCRMLIKSINYSLMHTICSNFFHKLHKNQSLSEINDDFMSRKTIFEKNINTLFSMSLSTSGLCCCKCISTLSDNRASNNWPSTERC